IVSVKCGDNDDSDNVLKATFNKVSKEIDLEVYSLGDKTVYLKSSIETPVDYDDEIETLTLSELEITEYNYEFVLNVKYKEVTKLPDESYTEMYMRKLDLVNQTKYVFRLGRDNLKLRISFDDESDEVLQCKLLEKQI
ncbi:hypothetical protein N9E99_02995, partial [Gammaproteobacteria bacterium]|nr:hypothetical protein [Gammaproteobacteria bacterium]